jgi:hypothetical protein
MVLCEEARKTHRKPVWWGWGRPLWADLDVLPNAAHGCEIRTTRRNLLFPYLQGITVIVPLPF